MVELVVEDTLTEQDLSDKRDIIDQTDKIDEKTEDELKAIAYYWDRIQDRLGEDSICFNCKQKLDTDVLRRNARTLEVDKKKTPDEGMIIFISICSKCYLKAFPEDKNETNKE